MHIYIICDCHELLFFFHSFQEAEDACVEDDQCIIRMTLGRAGYDLWLNNTWVRHTPFEVQI